MPASDAQRSPPPAGRTSSAVLELTLMRLRMFLREPEALFWTFGFPIILAIGLGLAFGNPRPEPAQVAVERGSLAEAHLPALQANPEVEPRVLAPQAAADALRRGEVDLLLAGTDTLVYRYDPARAESRSARLLADAAIQQAAGGERPVPTVEVRQQQPGTRYIDWVIPGLIGLNLMSTGMWGIGFYIVDARQRKQLKRLVATPMRRRDFLLAQILARLVFVFLEVPPIILFAWLAFGVRVEGSLLAVAAIVLLGGMTFAALGLLASSRARTIEGVSGIMNVVMLPMFVLSGVFFSASRFPDPIQPLIRVLPLTAMNDALRAVYNEGAPLTGAALPVLVLGAWMLGSIVLALWWFRWQ